MKSINRIIPISLGTTLLLITACNKEQKDLPVASFKCPNTVGVGDTIYFRNTSEGANTYDWDFGDGDVSTEENPNHFYTERGVFTILLVATNEDGSDEASWDILIKPWRTRASMPTPRDATTSAVNGKIYAFGGRYQYPHSIATNEEYDPASNSWTVKKDMITARTGSSASAVDGKIYVIGGIETFTDFLYSTVEMYDPATDDWITKTSMPTARLFLSTCVVNGKIYAIGGEKAIHGTVLSVVEEYDPVTDTWATKAPMLSKRWGLSTSVVNGKIYAIGGCRQISPPFTSLSTVEEYDPATDTWTTKTNMPTARFWPSACTVNELIYVIGGLERQNGTTYGTVEEYNPATDTWATRPGMPTPRLYVSTSVVNGKIYAIGGMPCSGCLPVNTNEEYTPPAITSVENKTVISPKGFLIR
jgi:N-acetylneuraminic acid mutarotase